MAAIPQNPYVWIVKFNWLSGDSQPKQGMDVYQNYMDAERMAEKLRLCPGVYTNVEVCGRDVQTSEYVSYINEMAKERAVA